MVTHVFCLRKKAELTLEEFHRYWREEHAELVRRHAPVLRIRRYVQSHTFHDPRLAGAFAARGSEVAPFDGVAQVWWDSVEDLTAVGSTDEGRAAIRALREDERKFIDLAQSPIFSAEDHVVLA